MKIIGVTLIKNEDIYIEGVINNVLDFCDEIIVLDNNSTDNTFDIISNMAKRHSKIKIHRIDDPLATHVYVEPYVNTDSWVFAVDGDELYDPIGLIEMRKNILAGKYSDVFRLKANFINVTNIDKENQKAYGYNGIATKGHNVSLLDYWHEDKEERLHGKNMRFKEGIQDTIKSKFLPYEHWENSKFRCLHLCFMKRSSKDTKFVSRFIPAENKRKYYYPVINFFKNLLMGRFELLSSYKNKTYRNGKIIYVDSTNFFIKKHD